MPSWCKDLMRCFIRVFDRKAIHIATLGVVQYSQHDMVINPPRLTKTTLRTFDNIKMVINTFLQMRNTSSKGLSTKTDHSPPVMATEVMYGLIATLSFLLNSLFSLVMVRKLAMLKRPHNILLFALAVADLLTGLYLLCFLLRTIYSQSKYLVCNNSRILLVFWKP